MKRIGRIRAQRCWSYLATLLLLLVLIDPTRAEDPPELSKLRTNFQQQIELSSKGFGDLDKKYLEALNRLVEVEKGKGNLDAVLEAQKEIEFHGDGTKFVETAFRNRISDIDSLQGLQNTYLKARGEIDATNLENEKKVAELYYQKLEELTAELTKGGRLDDALLVKKEQESVKSRYSSGGVRTSETPAPEESESEPIRVRAHVTAKAQGEIFVNGESLYFRMDSPDDGSGIDGKSRFFEVREGDTVVVRVRSNFVYRALALAFEMPDNDRVLFFKGTDFKVMGVGNDFDPSAVSAEGIGKAPDKHPEKTFPDNYWQELWDDHRLDGGGFLKPEPQGEWVVWGTILTEEMLQREGE